MDTDISCKELLKDEAVSSPETFVRSSSRAPSCRDGDVSVIEDETRYFTAEPNHLQQGGDDSHGSNSNSNILIIDLEGGTLPISTAAAKYSESADSEFDANSLTRDINDYRTEVASIFHGQVQDGSKEFSLQEESSPVAGGSILSPFAETFGGSIHCWRQQPSLPSSLHYSSIPDLEPACLSTSTWWPQEMHSNSDVALRNIHEETRNREAAWCGHAYDHSRALAGYGGGSLQESLSYYYPQWSSTSSNGYSSSLEGTPDDGQYPLDSAVNSTRSWLPPMPTYPNHLTAYSDTLLRNVSPSSTQDTTPNYTPYQSESHDDTTESSQHRLSSLHTPPPLLEIGSPPQTQPEDNATFEVSDDCSISNQMLLNDPERNCDTFRKEPVDLRVVRASLQPLSIEQTTPSTSYPATSIIPSTCEDKNKVLTCFMVYPVNGTNSVQPRFMKPTFTQPAQVRRPQPSRYITVREMLAERARTESAVNVRKRECLPDSRNVQNPQPAKSTATTCYTTVASAMPSHYSSALPLSAQFPITSALLSEPKTSTASSPLNNIFLYPVNSSTQVSSLMSNKQQIIPETHNVPDVSCNIIVDSSTQRTSRLSIQQTELDVSQKITASSLQKKMRKTTTEDKSNSAVTSTAPHLLWKEGHLVKIKNNRHCRASVRKPLHFDVQNLFIGKFKVEVFTTKRVKLLNRLKIIFSKRLFVYEFDIPDNVGDSNRTLSKVAAIQFPFSTIEAIHCDSRLVQVKVKQPPEMFVGCRKLHCKTGGGNIQYNKSENVDLTGGELARYPLHELLLRKEEAERLQTSLEEFDASFKKKMSNIITVDCQEPEPKSLTHIMIEQPTVDIVGDSDQQWKRFCLDLDQANTHRSIIEQSFMSIS